MSRAEPAARRLRILLLSTSFPLAPGEESGVFVERLARALAARHDVRVLTPDAAVAPAAGDERPYALHRVRYAPRRWQVLAHGPGGIPGAVAAHPAARLLVPAMLAAMTWSCWRRAPHCDLVFANWSVNGLVAGIAGRLRGKPVVTALRGEDANRALTSPAYRWLLGACLRLSRRVVAVSRPIADQLAGLRPGGAPIAAIANGVDPAFLAIDRAPRDSADLRLVAVGSLVQRKAVDLLLRALAGCPGGVTATIVGAGPEHARLVALASELGVAARVCFAGSVAPAAIPALLGEHDALVLTSRREGRPNAVVEGLAAALPVVASDIPGVRELVSDGENGLLFAPGDAAALTTCLLRLRDATLRRRLGEAARERVIAEGLTWEATARGYERVFADALAER